MTAVTMCSYDGTLFRVLLDMTAVRTALGHDATGLVERSTDQIQWTTVRGASAVTVSATAPAVSDYEFTPDAVNYYRVTPDTGVYTDSITPDLAGQVVLKNLRYPFLNRAVKLSDAGDITRPANGTTFTVLGRSFQVAVAVVRGGRQFDLTVETDTDEDTADLAGLLSTGDVILLQVPGDYPVPLAGYYAAGDTAETRNGVPWSMRWTTIPLTEVAPPAADVAPITGTWETVTSNYATWADLATALATWADVVSLVGAPADVIVT